LTSGRDVYEELGPSFTLLALGVEGPEVAVFEDVFKSHNVPLRVLRDTYESERQAYGSSLVLVRPDQYVVWQGDAAPPDPAALVKKVTGLT
jgi:hypothetical protein